MNVTAAIPEVGQIVRVRQRLYLVEGLVARPRPQASTLVELSCIEVDAQGQELAVLWERKLDAAILTGEEWARLAQRGFDSAEYFSAYLNTLRWNCVTSTDASLLQSPFRAGIPLDAYQLEPLRKALRPIDACYPFGGTGGWTSRFSLHCPSSIAACFKSSASRASSALSNFHTSWFASLPR